MTSLSVHIDRLSSSAKKITNSTASIVHPSINTTPFTNAVVGTTLGDLIREVDESELGLFTLTSEHPTVNPSALQLSRTGFTGPTPLKPRNNRGERAGQQAAPDLSPEAYAEAALKYIERYDAFRPMPRYRSQAEDIVSQLADLRKSIHILTETYEQERSTRSQQDEDNPTRSKQVRKPSPKSLIEEERRVHELQSKIEQLKQRKEAAEVTRAARFPRTGLDRLKSRLVAPPSPATPASKYQNEEDMFWTTPSSSTRALRFSTNLLTEEHFDVNDISTSFSSPMAPHPRNFSNPPADRLPSEETSQYPSIDDERQPGPQEIQLTEQTALPPQQRLDDSLDVSEDNVSPDEVPLPESPPPRDLPTPSTPAAQIAMVNTPGRTKKVRVKVTYEVERIIAKIWTTMGDLIMPGHPFDTAEGGINKPPRAKQTIAHLEELSSSMPVTLSPSVSSYSSMAHAPSGPTPQQILTAHLFLCLLSSADFAMPLNNLKETLTRKSESGVGGQAATRIIYGCVAKRMLKIDRGGRVQVAKFDV